jgi:hypothetical protein
MNIRRTVTYLLQQFNELVLAHFAANLTSLKQSQEHSLDLA